MHIKKPKISVLMPVYNGEKYLKAAIDSILGQTFNDFELLLINDGSTDGSKKIIEKYNDNRIRFIDNLKNKGLISSLNQGLEMASGKYIARMDQDDVSLPNRFQKQYNFIENNPEIALVGGWAKVIDQNGKQTRDKKMPLSFKEIKFHILFHNPFIHSTIFFKKDIVKKIGRYSEKYEHAEDFELYSRLVKNYKIINLPEFLIKFRVHESSIGQTPKTKKIQEGTVKKIIFNNTNDYLKINSDDFDILYYGKKITSIKKLFKVIFIYKNIFNSYIRKESLQKTQIKKIKSIYTKKQKNLIKQYIKNKLYL